MRTSEAQMIQASLVARLLGIRLLTIHANVVVSPAPTAATSPLRVSSRGIGGRLTDAERLLDEAAATLDAPPTDGAGA
jgi:hypothetical protein